MIIGESPSNTRPEGMENVNFSGRTSAVLWDTLYIYGKITRKHCLLLNLYPKKEYVKNAPPRVLEHSIKKIQTQLLLYRPDVILILGKKVSKIVHEHLSLENFNVVNTYHPSAVTRFPGKFKKTFEADVRTTCLLGSLHDSEKHIESGGIPSLGLGMFRAKYHNINTT